MNKQQKTELENYEKLTTNLIDEINDLQHKLKAQDELLNEQSQKMDEQCKLNIWWLSGHLIMTLAILIDLFFL